MASRQEVLPTALMAALRLMRFQNPPSFDVRRVCSAYGCTLQIHRKDGFEEEKVKLEAKVSAKDIPIMWQIVAT